MFFIGAAQIGTHMIEIVPGMIEMKQGWPQPTIHRIDLNDIEKIVACYTILGWPFIRLIINKKMILNSPKRKSLTFYIFTWNKRRLTGQHQIFMILNSLSRKCDVYVEGWPNLSKGKRMKWQPVDTWKPYEIQDNEKSKTN